MVAGLVVNQESIRVESPEGEGERLNFQKARQ